MPERSVHTSHLQKTFSIQSISANAGEEGGVAFPRIARVWCPAPQCMMKSQRLHDKGKHYKARKNRGTTPSFIPMFWTGCYISGGVLIIFGLLLGGGAGVVVARVVHFVFWSLAALLRFIIFLHTS